MPRIPSKLKARRNRIRSQKRRPRIRMASVSMSPDTWVRDRFITTPRVPPPTVFGGILSTAGPPTKAVQLHRGPRLRERFRIIGWIFRLLRR